MRRLSAIINWFQFLVWCALALWSAINADYSKPWREMFSIVCLINAWDRAFVTEPPKEENK